MNTDTFNGMLLGAALVVVGVVIGGAVMFAAGDKEIVIEPVVLQGTPTPCENFSQAMAIAMAVVPDDSDSSWAQRYASSVLGNWPRLTQGMVESEVVPAGASLHREFLSCIAYMRNN